MGRRVVRKEDIIARFKGLLEHRAIVLDRGNKRVSLAFERFTAKQELATVWAAVGRVTLLGRFCDSSSHRLRPHVESCSHDQIDVLRPDGD